jgi:hypothetical protein
MKIQLDYDEVTGNVSCETGFIASFPHLSQYEVKQESASNVSDLVKLKDAGFSAEEIIFLSSRGII